MARLLPLIFAGIVLVPCGHGEYIPQWAGGPPNNLPPRPGTPEYDTWRQQLDAERARDKSKDPPGEKKDLPPSQRAF
jgi:hypothetical protein